MLVNVMRIEVHIPLKSQGRVGCIPGPKYPVMENPYISPIARGYLWLVIPKNPKVEHNKYHGYTVRGTPNCPLKEGITRQNAMPIYLVKILNREFSFHHVSKNYVSNLSVVLRSYLTSCEGFCEIGMLFKRCP